MLMHMTSTPRFSVIIPCWNQARFLPEAVGSLLRQGIGGIETIVVNDGSPDDTAAVAAKLAKAHPELSLSLLEQPNLGPAVARNTGIARARGEWIVTLDSDDILADGFLAAAAGAAEREPAANAFTGAYREFGAQAGEWKLTRFDPERLTERGNILSCSPFTRRLWERAGGFDSSHPWGAEDWHFWLKCLGEGLSLRALPVPMLHYRIHETGGRMSAMQRYWDDTLAMHRTMLPELYPKPVLLAAHEHLRRIHPETEAALLRKREALPALPLPHFWLGLAHEGRGEADAARSSYRRALELGEKSTAAQDNAYAGTADAAFPGGSRTWSGSWQAMLRLDCLGRDA